MANRQIGDRDGPATEKFVDGQPAKAATVAATTGARLWDCFRKSGLGDLVTGRYGVSRTSTTLSPSRRVAAQVILMASLTL
jgi:hypothetical protein